LDHSLVFLRSDPDFPAKVTAGCLGQEFVGQAAVVFAWTTVPYRTEWRYSVSSHKVIAMDAGHMCQNLYLACEAIGAGTCAVGAYHQERMDALLGVDGEDEFTIYLAPVGKVG
ncbi:MAG TPA: SagB/ThcOx family dehydrogenase, partial [Candidatus Bipolaricaulis anaerobius]|nr:SagB/ThcOx family dehydrogenase [Candidatus Bipolaricaulis anaerobius]